MTEMSEAEWITYPKYDCVDKDSPFYKMRKGDIVSLQAVFNGESLDYDISSMEITEPVLMIGDRVSWKKDIDGKGNINHYSGEILHIEGLWAMIRVGNAYKPTVAEVADLERI